MANRSVEQSEQIEIKLNAIEWNWIRLAEKNETELNGKVLTEQVQNLPYIVYSSCQ